MSGLKHSAISEFVRKEMGLNLQTCTHEQINRYMDCCDQLHGWKAWSPEKLPTELKEQLQ